MSYTINQYSIHCFYECNYTTLNKNIYTGPSFRIGILGNYLGPQSQRGPRILTAKQKEIWAPRPSMQLNICRSYFLLVMATAISFLMKYSFIISFAKY